MTIKWGKTGKDTYEADDGEFLVGEVVKHDGLWIAIRFADRGPLRRDFKTLREAKSFIERYCQ